jgi:hypothetical protein
MELKEELKEYPNFNDIEISTKTVIAHTNLKLNIKEIFEKIPITDYVIVQKRRGRKKKEVTVDPNKDIPEGSIITLKYQKLLRGVDLKAKKKSTKGGFFRNSLTVVTIMDGKILNYKISDNGKFQITGCKKDDHPVKVIDYFLKYLKSHCEGNYQYTGELSAIFITVMTNIDFNLGFTINKENLDHYINTKTDFNSLLETSFGYTGVNIKIPLCIPSDFNLEKVSYDQAEGIWVKSTISYLKYLKFLPEKDKAKELKKVRYNTFLVFHSGNVIMSSMKKDFMEEYYYKFVNIIKECKNEIKEKIEL